MKKNKSEIILFFAVVIFIIAGMFCLAKSQGVMTSVEIPYEENSSVNYKVYLNDTSYYNKEYLDEGMQYISSIIDYVDLDFRYVANFQGITNYNVNKIVTADVKITDKNNSEKVIYFKSETLKEENQELENLIVNDNIKINYGKYNDIVNEIKSKYGISANAILTVSYRVLYSSPKEGINKGKIIKVDIPLSEQMINIDKPANSHTTDIYIGNEINSFTSIILMILMLIMFLIAMILAVVLVRKVTKRIKSESKYDRFINRVLREYDSYITEAKEENKLPYKDVIKVDSFKELLDVRNNVEKAIIYTKIDDDTSKFQIIDEQIYEYKVTRKEMDE